MTHQQVDVENICYKKNYLTEVIARVDFLYNLDEIEKKFPKSIYNQAVKSFKIPEPKQTILQKEFILAPDGNVHETRQKQVLEWRFNGEQREKYLKISSSALVIAYSKFKSFRDLREDFTGIFRLFSSTYRDLQYKRIGLRYVNNINLDENDPLNWKDYLNNNLLSGFDFYDEKQYLARLFNNLEFKFDEFNLRFQYGMFNPDFPSPIRRKLFVLDFDAYSQGILEFQEVLDHLELLHSKIQTIFEMSITDKFRNYLNE